MALNSFFVAVAALMFAELLGGVSPVAEPGADETGLDLGITDLPILQCSRADEAERQIRRLKTYLLLHIIYFVDLVYI